jgi:hypothetical protein
MSHAFIGDIDEIEIAPNVQRVLLYICRKAAPAFSADILWIGISKLPEITLVNEFSHDITQWMKVSCCRSGIYVKECAFSNSISCFSETDSEYFCQLINKARSRILLTILAGHHKK